MISPTVTETTPRLEAVPPHPFIDAVSPPAPTSAPEPAPLVQLALRM